MAVYQRDGGEWRVDVWWNGEVVWTTHAPTKGEGQAIHDQAKVDLRAGITEPWKRYETSPRHKRMTVGDWIAEWRLGRGLSPKAERSQGSAIDLHIVPALGHVPLEDLTRLQVQRWVKALERDLMPRSVRTVYGILALALADAADDPSTPISLSPAHRIRLEKPEQTGRMALTPMQVAAIARHMPNGNPMAVWNLFFTGMRSAELIARDRHDLTLRRTIEIRGRPAGGGADGEAAPRPVRGKRGRTRQAASKTAAGARSIILADSHAEAVSAELARHSSSALSVRWHHERYPHLVAAGPVRWSYQSLHAQFTGAVTAARKAGEDVPKDATPHWARVTMRTWLSAAGVPDVARDAQLGHATPGMTGVYERVTPEMEQMIRDALEARWREAHGLAPAKRARRAR